MESQWNDKIFTVSSLDFEDLALEIFRFQYASNPVYHKYVNALRIDVNAVHSIIQVPFLPISFFKSHRLQSGVFDASLVFESSGTSGSINSRHFIKDITIYEQGFSKTFELFYGSVKDLCIIGLLPSYLERSHSSLVYMVNELINKTGHPDSGFYLQDHDRLYSVLTALKKQGHKTILIGVTFALLDFAEMYTRIDCPEQLGQIIIMETGGMKGRRAEMTRMEVHEILKTAFNIPVVHSEYGMTELLSQAYSNGAGIFHCPSWMKVLIRDDEDPLSVSASRNGLPISGAINVIDLANIYSCSFVATDDAGRLYPDGSFEVLGRIDNSDIRGCSLMTI